MKKRRQALHHIYGPQAALTDGYGYWVSEKWPNNDGPQQYKAIVL